MEPKIGLQSSAIKCNQVQSSRSHEVDDGAEDDGVEAVEGQADKRIGDAVNDRWVKGLPALLVEDVTLRHATRRGWTEAVNRW